jgi:polysaccharide biosynthesis/export protein
MAKSIKTFDVYAFLQNPGTDDDFFLQDNDYLVVGTVGKLVSIDGAVKRPMTYEMLPGEELSQLIKFTGGLNANAMASRSQVKRYVGKNLSLLPINLDSITQLKQDYKLQNGDALNIGNVNGDLENSVEVKGPVYFPGVFPDRRGR